MNDKKTRVGISYLPLIKLFITYWNLKNKLHASEWMPALIAERTNYIVGIVIFLSSVALKGRQLIKLKLTKKNVFIVTLILRSVCTTKLFSLLAIFLHFIWNVCGLVRVQQHFAHIYEREDEQRTNYIRKKTKYPTRAPRHDIYFLYTFLLWVASERT